MKKKKVNFRHGDVLIIPTTIPEKAVEETRNGDVILAEGEVTGHAHRITKGAKLFRFEDKVYLRVTKQACLTHEEHKALKIPAGDFQIKIQQDYEPEGWKRVQD